ncbi:hypothetical protein LCGC14_2086480 [marine sediment metagenome]|uniref:Uncharacterized protein n=1 Tax=marine sediment metagenome TaxID=412755 RepID=A0A0F9EEB1_9ZZZZ
MAVELGNKAFWDRLTDNPARLAAEVCMVDVANLDRTLEQHAALRAWVNASHEAARIGEERLKWEHTKARARVLLTARQELDGVTGKNKSVAVLDAEVTCSTEVQEAMSALLDQQEKRGALRAMSDALEDRKDMLIQIAAKQRKERGDY